MNDTITLEIERNLKNELEQICKELGINVLTAFMILARKFINEQRNYDPFYSPSNIKYLEKITAEIDSGKAKLEEHALLTNKQLKTIEKAEQGDAEAQRVVGVYYDSGNVLERDYDKAIYWYTKAAKQGNFKSQYRLGIIYSKIKPDIQKSYMWFEVAVACGLPVDFPLREYMDSLTAQLTPSQIRAAKNNAQQIINAIKQKAGK